MLTIHKWVTSSPEQMEMIIEGMRNPLNSWDKIDSQYNASDDELFTIGPNDEALMTKLAAGGPVHAKYRRMMDVIAHIEAPLYWWKEFDTYKVGTVCNSCSTMHTIHTRPLTLDDFSHENLYDAVAISNLTYTIHVINDYRTLFLECKDKKYWWNIIQLLPSSFNQLRTVKINYEVLANIYASRRNHKLDEWHDFCHWIENLPYSQLITGEFDDEEDVVDEEIMSPNHDDLIVALENARTDVMNRFEKLGKLFKGVMG